MALRIGINGFGRIGRTLFRVIADSRDIQIVGVNDLAPAANLAYLLQYDTVLGRYDGPVQVKDSTISAGTHPMQMFNCKEPTEIPWKKIGADIVIEATGKFVDRQGCEKHLQAGAKKVLLSAPAKDDVDITVVYGVN